MLGMFSYAAVQQLKALPDGPAFRRFLIDGGWNGYGESDEGWPALDRVVSWLLGRLGREVPAPAPDPLADLDPDDDALDAVFADVARQANERAASGSY